MTDIKMPQLGETVADGTVAKWFKKVGDTVVRGEPLFEVSTDKVDTEIPAPADGVLTSILVSEGTTVDVGTVLAVIGGSGDEASAPAASAAAAVAAAASSAPAATRVVAPKTDEKLSPVVRKLLAEHGLDASQVPSTGPGGRLTRDDVLAFVASQVSAPATSAPLSPVVRKLLAEHGLDASQVRASGPDGRITRKDVEAAIGKGVPARTSTGDEVIPFTKIRKLTADHMVRSKATSAHTLMVREIDYENVDLVRRSHGAAWKEREGYSLTYLPFNAIAVLGALREFPHLNASVGNDELIVHHDLNLGIAVDIENEGLVVPVVHGADGYNLRTIAAKIRDLATRARTKKLGPDEMARGTFTITNPGPFGTLITGAVINQPQVAILSTDGVTRKPVVVTDERGGESIAIHSVGLVALTFDHRAVDGAYVARFLQRFAEILQTKNWAEFL